MKIKATLDFVALEHSLERDAQKLAQDFDVIVELVHVPHAPGAQIHVFGEPHQIMRMLQKEENGWGTGNEAEDAEFLFAVFQNATEVYG